MGHGGTFSFKSRLCHLSPAHKCNHTSGSQEKANRQYIADRLSRSDLDPAAFNEINDIALNDLARFTQVLALHDLGQHAVKALCGETFNKAVGARDAVACASSVTAACFQTDPWSQAAIVSLRGQSGLSLVAPV